MENKILPAQVKCVKTIMGKLKTKDGDAMVLGFTKMRTFHVSEMTVKEGTERIRICLHAYNTDDEIGKLNEALLEFH